MKLFLEKNKKLILLITCIVLVVALLLTIIFVEIDKHKMDGEYFIVSTFKDEQKEIVLKIKNGKVEIKNEGFVPDYDGKIITKKKGSSIKIYIEENGEEKFYTELRYKSKGVIEEVKDGVVVESYISNKHKHKFGDFEVILEAKCTENGKLAKKCSKCGAIEDKKEILAIGHTNSNEWTTTLEPTCKEEGLRKKKCVRCEYSFEEEKILPLGHEDSALWETIKEATCIENGKKIKKCARCKEVLEERQISVLGHLYIWNVTKEPTCEDSGHREGVCERCSNKTEQILDSLGHNYINWTIVDEPTCLGKGKEKGKCSRCDGEDFRDVNALGHNYTNWNITLDPTCTTPGLKVGTCSRCSNNKEEEIECIGHLVDISTGLCLECNLAPNVGEFILFGTYPQSEVYDNELKNTLSNLAGKKPDLENANNFISYNYYISSFNTLDYMWYKDIEYNGDKYRCVYFTRYRPCYIDHTSGVLNSYIDDNGFLAGEYYFFKFEPIKWQILSSQDGNMTLISNLILDSQDFNHNIGQNNGYFANNYEQSSIRSWLNDMFYNTAFNEAQKIVINTKTVDNSVELNDYACLDTQDKIWLLSYSEAYEIYFNTTIERQKKTTRYAQCQGAYTSIDAQNIGCGHWWIRTPKEDDENYSYAVDIDGGDSSYSVIDTDFGVVPVIEICI